MKIYLKYAKIAKDIKQKIINNIYKTGQLLPSESQLSQEYNVCRRTVRHAILTLVEDGYLYTVPGKGTFVYVKQAEEYQVNLQIEDVISQGFDNVKLYSAKIQNPDIYQVYNLSVAPNEKVLSLQWLLLREDNIIGYDVKTIPYYPGIPVDESDFSYTTLREILESKFLHFQLEEEASLSSLIPNEEIRGIMNLDPNYKNPVLTIDIMVYSTNMQPLGWNKIYLKPDECEIAGESIF
ncbi:MAG: GntR family transcriptional regulator [Eubacteriaceae bacterium]